MRGRPKNIIPEPAVGQVYRAYRDQRTINGITREDGAVVCIAAVCRDDGKTRTWTWHDWQKYAARAKLVTA